MTKEFVPYELSLELKQIGFDEPCFGYYNTDPIFKNPPFNLSKPFDHEWCLLAPLYQQAFRWLLDKNKDLNITFYFDGSGVIDDPTPDNTNIMFRFNTLDECLIKLIEIVKNGKS